MDFFELIAARRSMRKYARAPVEEAQLQRILEAVRQAPSAGNLQAFVVYVVRRPEDRQALVHAAFEQEFLAEAPVVLVFCAVPAQSAQKYGERGATLYALQDATIACTYAMLAAKALGLDSVWVGAFREDEVSRLLALPDGHRPIAMLPIGYAGTETRPPPRRPLEELVYEIA